MKFIVDAQLPKRLAHWITNQGFDCLHTLDLPEQNLTEDMGIIRVSEEENRTVISKDNDFYEYFILKQSPPKLLMVTTGNITNRVLLKLFEDNFDKILTELEQNSVVELSNEAITVHF